MGRPAAAAAKPIGRPRTDLGDPGDPLSFFELIDRRALRAKGKNMLRKSALTLILILMPLVSVQAQPSWTLGAGDTEETNDSGDVQDWTDDIINVTVTEPGVLTFDAQGVDFEGDTATEDVCASGTRNLPSGWLSRTDGRYSIPVQPGDYAIQLHLHGLTTYQYRVRGQLLGPCAVPAGDDHGDSPLCATLICDGTPESAAIGSYTPPDADLFTFVLDSSATVTIESTGSTDVLAELYDEDGYLLASDDDSGSGTNFLMVESLGIGRYFVRVEGVSSATGSYTIEVD